MNILKPLFQIMKGPNRHITRQGRFTTQNIERTGKILGKPAKIDATGGLEAPTASVWTLWTSNCHTFLCSALTFIEKGKRSSTARSREVS